MIFMVCFIGSLTCVFWGMSIERGKWIHKSKCHTRMLSKGRFYFVVEDGDRKKLKSISDCFDAAEAGSGYENKVEN